MIRVPPLRSAFALVASVTLTFIVFQHTATIPVEPAAPGAAHSRIA